MVHRRKSVHDSDESNSAVITEVVAAESFVSGVVQSGSEPFRDRREVKYDPYDVCLVWLCDHRDNPCRWITVPWRLLERTATPFGELAWDHAARDLRQQGKPAGEDEIAKAVGDLLHRAGTGPLETTKRSSRREAKVIARTRATAESARPRPSAPPPDQHVEAAETEAEDADEHIADVIPLKVFDARKEARKWW